MKVIAFNGSPHENGTVYKGITTVKEELEREGIEVEIIHIGNKNIRGCMACGACRTLKHCFYTDDLVKPSFDKINEADGVILGSPVYYGGISGTFKCFLDRFFFSAPNLKYKVGGTVVSLRRSGGIATFQALNNYLNLSQVIITPSMYWNVIHGNNSEELIKDEEGMQIMRVLGKNMAWLLKIVNEGKKENPFPSAEPRIFTNFIR